MMSSSALATGALQSCTCRLGALQQGCRKPYGRFASHEVQHVLGVHHTGLVTPRPRFLLTLVRYANFPFFYVTRTPSFMMTHFTQLTPSQSMRITTPNPIVPSELSSPTYILYSQSIGI